MSQNKVYVGNLSYDVSSADLEQFFSQYGEITESKLITDRDTGRSKGFAFITFATDAAAQASLAADGQEQNGRKLRVNLARDEQRRGGGGGGAGAGGARRSSGGGQRSSGGGGNSRY